MKQIVKKIPVKTIYLTAKNIPKKAIPEWPENYKLTKQTDINPDKYLKLYNEIGTNWGWTAYNLLSSDELKLKLNANTTHIYYLINKEKIAGYFELKEHKSSIEILYMGLVSNYIGKGLGNKLINHALFEASKFPFSHIMLHTCEFDHKRALETYLNAGFTIYKKQIDWEFYPIKFITKHTTMTINERLEELRALMIIENIDAYIITGTDPHLSEYLPERWQIRKWISGFSGSAGRIVITQEFAGLWTDSRYFLQAENELKDTKFELVKLKIPHTPEYIEWLQQHVKQFQTIAVDGKLIAYNEGTALNNALSQKKININFQLDLISRIWKDRPEFPMNQPFILDEKFAGESSISKISRLHKLMKEKGLDYFLVSALDEIAWLFNIRANDVIFNPVAYAYAIISEEEVILYIKKEKLNKSLTQYFDSLKVKIKDYESIDDFFESIYFGANFGIDPDKTNKFFGEKIPTYTQLKLGTSPISELKATKNEIEINNTRKAMVKDGIALTKFFRWVEEIAPKESETEYTLGVKLNEFRSEQDNFVSDSFNPIVGFNANGAIVHYGAQENTALKIKANGILLVDSGGQYFEGTTDITRTIALGQFPEEAKTDFTLVLKGHIQLTMASFPKGTAGYQLDLLARLPMWKAGKNYGHGTGHGVGYFLNVHEGPQSIRPRSAEHVPMTEGMITSNEPGYYPTGKYGIRVENLILTKKDKSTDDGEFLHFETLSLFPIDRRLIKIEMLTPEEKNWLNTYHTEVYEKLSPFLNLDEKEWMKKQTMHL